MADEQQQITTAKPLAHIAVMTKAEFDVCMAALQCFRWLEDVGHKVDKQISVRQQGEEITAQAVISFGKSDALRPLIRTNSRVDRAMRRAS